MMIWLVGAKGMLAQDIIAVLNKDGKHKVVATAREVDLSRRKTIQDFAKSLPEHIDVIINCVAWTDVDGTGDNITEASLANREIVKMLARFALKNDSKLVHFSSDYVFNGVNDVLLTEDMEPDSKDMYGMTKLLGDRGIKESKLQEYYILRTSWLYGRHGKNFVDTMLKLMNERNEISIINDQFGTPTSTMDLAQTVLTVLEQNPPYGIYNYSGEGRTSWFEFANNIYKIGKELKLIDNNCVIKPITTEEYPTKARRPKFSVMSKEKIKSALGIEIPKWEDSLRVYLESKKN
jgi:dTDP-4-dehydrorhamnose reductase